MTGKRKKQQRPWHPIEWAILLHVARYGITSPQALAQFHVKGVKTIEQAKHRLTALKRRRDLIGHPLDEIETYYSLSPAASKRLQQAGHDVPAPITSLRRFAQQTAMLQLCCQQPGQMQPLTPTEIRQHLPMLNAQRQWTAYYLSTVSNQRRIGLLRVDSFSSGRWDRLAHKVHADREQHAMLGDFKSTIDAQQFEITVVTALPEKATRIEEFLNRQDSNFGIDCRVLAMPELLRFVMPQASKTNTQLPPEKAGDIFLPS